VSEERKANPYAPPAAPLREVRTWETGSAARGLLLGFLCDMGTSIVGIAILIAAMYALLSASGAPEEAIFDSMGMDDPTSVFSISAMVIEGLGAMLGGWVCARVARHSEYRLAAILAALIVAAGFAFGGDFDTPTSKLIDTVVVGLSTMLGTWLAVRRTRRERAG